MIIYDRKCLKSIAAQLSVFKIQFQNNNSTSNAIINSFQISIKIFDAVRSVPFFSMLRYDTRFCVKEN